MYVLIDDGRGRLTLRRLWPWQRILARSAAARLDSALAGGARPEASIRLAARATRLTSTPFRRDLAASLRRILIAVGEPALPAPARSPLGAARPVRAPLRPVPISKSAPLLAELASRLLEPGPVPGSHATDSVDSRVQVPKRLGPGGTRAEPSRPRLLSVVVDCAAVLVFVRLPLLGLSAARRQAVTGTRVLPVRP